jgi:hypothetical protein
MRVLIYRSDYGPITEVIDGKEITRNRLVTRLFELAVTGAQALPRPDDEISVTGRFLKFHAIPVKPNNARDRAHHVDRQSDNVYTYFIVANAYRALPPPGIYDFHWLEYVIISVVIVGVAMFWWLSRRERAAAEVVQGHIKQIRKQRAGLVGKLGEPAPTPADSAKPPADAAQPPADATKPADAPPADPPAAS